MKVKLIKEQQCILPCPLSPKGGDGMLKVMLVDDMEAMIKEIKRMKIWGERTGFIVSEQAGNGQEALQKLVNSSIDLIITDIRMPKIDGIELLRKVMEDNLSPCVVLLSEYSEFDYARQGLVLGAFDYVVKPVQEDDLEKLLQRARTYIANKQDKERQIKEMEERLTERVEAFFPTGDLEEIIKLICSKDDGAVQRAAEMVEKIGAALDYDLLKAALVLENVWLAMLKGILREYSWLDRFSEAGWLTNLDFSDYHELDSMKSALQETVGKIIMIVNRYECGIGGDNKVVKKVCRYVLDNIETEVSLKTIAEALYLNKSYLSEIFKQKTGMTLGDYLTMVKMERAKELVRVGKFRNYEIADKFGYKDVEYFSRLFKRYTGYSPSEFRQRKLTS